MQITHLINIRIDFVQFLYKKLVLFEYPLNIYINTD